MILALSLLPILVLLLLAAGRSQLLRLQDAAAELQRHFDLVMTAEEVYKSIGHQAVSLRNIALYTDPEMIARETERLYARREDAERMLYRLEAEELTAEERYWVAQSVDVFRRIADYQDEVLLLLAAGRTEEAIERMNGTGAELRDRFEQTVGEMANHWEKEMADRLLGAPADFRRAVAEGALASLVVVLSLILFLGRNIWSVAVRLKTVSDVMAEVAGGTAGLDTRLPVRRNDEIDRVAKTFNAMAASLQEQVDKVRSEHWLKSSVADLTASLAGAAQPETIARRFLSKAAPATEACFGVFYLAETPEGEAEPVLRPLAAYACPDRSRAEREYRFGEGLAGQAALERAPIELQAVPSEYLGIRSGEGGERTLAVIALPVLYSEQVKAVVELASFTPFTERRREYLAEAVGLLGVLLENAESRQRLARLLRQSQAMTEALQLQSEELQSQQEELRRMNEELEEQAQSLKISEEKLKAQQEELEQANAELAERTKMLERQNRELERANRELNAARLELEEKAALLAQTSQYKSEFLANMSHELRTPLNSLLILSALLAENAGGNLTEKQAEYARVIHASGKDLLALIDDILDMAKVESGRMDVEPSDVAIAELADFAEAGFRPLAVEKNLAYAVVVEDGTPESLRTDKRRLQQVLRNLLANAFKFTESGEVRLTIGPAELNGRPAVAFAVSDTGIGIPKDKQEIIFEAFRQADGTTSRKYGGTGLGLSICKSFASLLRGELTVRSEVGKGSVFTFIVGDYEGAPSGAGAAAAGKDEAGRDGAAARGVAGAAEAAAAGVAVPVPAAGAAAGGSDAETASVKRLLIVDDDVRQRAGLMELIGGNNVVITAASTGAEALALLESDAFDCLVLDLGLSDADGFELLEQMRARGLDRDLKVFIYTGRALTSKEEIQLKKYAHTIIIKDALAPRRLMEELERFLGGGAAPEAAKAAASPSAARAAPDLAGKKVLLIDDDVRNVFALTSVLEMHGMNVVFAENGAEGLELLRRGGGFDIVVADIMMPEMDGYETIRRIRRMPRFEKLPVIAVTAKAMREDRERCIEAGASDYLSKPVDAERLVSLLKVWLYPQPDEGRA